MKKIYFISLLFFSIAIKAQDKYDYVWILNNNTLNNFIMVDWKDLKPDISIYKSASLISVWDNNGTISDKNGNFKFFSNGCVIAGKNLYPLPNGKDINPGYIHSVYCGLPYGTSTYPTYNNIVFLPKPEDSTRYILFHTARSESADSNSVTFPFVWMYYSEIDAQKGAYGTVIKKNIQLGPRDSLSEIGPIACKHANGRDWWVIVPGLHCHCYYRSILTPEGMQYIGKQTLQEEGPRDYQDWLGQGTFSPDGSKYVRSDHFNGTFVYDFDRCTGLLSKPIHIDTIVQSSGSGVAISPNSKYLYIANDYVLHQFDLTSTDILASKIKVAFLDTTFVDSSNDYVTFYKCLLAPDNKIYLAAHGSSDWMSIIHNPNEKGLACDFRQHDLQLPKDYSFGLPNMPHYRMPAKDVVCPPIIATKDQWENNQFGVFPNPSKGALTIENYEFNDIILKWELFDVQGKQVFSQQLQSEKTSLDLPVHLPQGIYFWRILNNTQQLAQGKLVITE